jgi:molybdopterin molybdotransferase
VEDTQERDGRVLFRTLPPPGRHISPRCEDLKRGQRVLQKGQLLNPHRIAVLAAVGCRRPEVWASPEVAYMGTGNELVEPEEPLPPGKIRNSNAYALGAQITAAGGAGRYLGIARDREDDLGAKIETGLSHDFLLLSGGVSRGRYDLVPEILHRLGVEIHFRRLRVQPGHPTLFGTKGRTAVFGLPGNPIATYFAFELYVAPLLRHFRHHPSPDTIWYDGVLEGETAGRPGKTRLIACRAEWRSGRFEITPVPTHGAADIFALAGADAIGIIPPDAGRLEAGARLRFCRLGNP